MTREPKSKSWATWDLGVRGSTKLATAEPASKSRENPCLTFYRSKLLSSLLLRLTSESSATEYQDCAALELVPSCSQALAPDQIRDHQTSSVVLKAAPKLTAATHACCCVFFSAKGNSGVLKVL